MPRLTGHLCEITKDLPPLGDANYLIGDIIHNQAFNRPGVAGAVLQTSLSLID